MSSAVGAFYVYGTASGLGSFTGSHSALRWLAQTHRALSEAGITVWLSPSGFIRVVIPIED